MSKKPEPPDRHKKRRQALIRTSSGARRPFLRGMVTHDLVQRGLSFDEAYATARAIRDRIADRDEISTAELWELVEEHLAETLGAEELARLGAPVTKDRPTLQVNYQGDPQPFSRGLLARSMHAAGIDLDRAYRFVTLVEGELRREGVQRLDSDELALRVGDLLEEHEGAETAARYRVVRSIRRLPRPLVLYLGGASGTGKSTLAVDLAPLLRIYRVNATDTVRQVMRMVFAPAILPMLHRSSFEALTPGSLYAEEVGRGGEAGVAERLRFAFEEQALRISVGVRALVDRAVTENMSIIVEGVHLVPPLIPFDDLEGAAYQLALMLTTLDEETHRIRFLARGRQAARSLAGGRGGERYLENFRAIRLLQEYLLEQAESHDVTLLDTTHWDTALSRSLRLITGMLQQRVPQLARSQAPGARGARPVPTLLLFLDGLADHPARALAGRTPLQAARLPTFDRLARQGRTGLADPVAPGVVPDTASGSLALLGQSPRAIKRGPVEALGAGLELQAGDIALRGNFATLDDKGRIIDRRAGRIREGAVELAAALDRMPLPGTVTEEVIVRVRAGTEHRLAVVLQGRGLSSDILGSDPGDGAPPGPPLIPRPEDPKDERAAHTARLVAVFEQEARRLLAVHPVNLRRQEKGLLPANAVLTRGPGHVHRLLPLDWNGVPLSVTVVSGDHTVLGLASWLGAQVVTDARMTGNLDTDLGAKFTAAASALEVSDLVVLHLKGADIAAHDRRPDQKVEFLERVDALLAELLGQHQGALRVAVGSDHATVSEAGQHAADPVPVLIWGEGIEADEVETFDETSAAGGSLSRFPLQLLMARLFEAG